MEGFYRKKDVARVLLVKEKKGSILGQVIFFFGGEGNGKGFQDFFN